MPIDQTFRIDYLPIMYINVTFRLCTQSISVQYEIFASKKMSQKNWECVIYFSFTLSMLNVNS